MSGTKRNIIILGAGGRDFHVFNLHFRNDPAVRVLAFTAAQIPFQEGRRYPSILSGPLYPEGIPIVSEDILPHLAKEEPIDEVVLAYSDISNGEVMMKASGILAGIADFRLLSFEKSMLPSRRPVISVCAVRTGCGKSPVTRFLCRHLLERGRRPAVIRHPMAYGSLESRIAQAFRNLSDLDGFGCTIEEREEYEPLIGMGIPLFAGVDYEKILPMAEAAGDVIVWDGGNNDLPFVRPDMEIVLADPWRQGDEVEYFPGFVNLLRAGVVVISKADGAPPKNIEALRKNILHYNPHAIVVTGALDVAVKNPTAIKGQRVVVVEDGPTLTHGGMSFGAGVVAATRYGALEIVDPRPHACGSLVETYRKFPHLTQVVPAMGYSDAQIDHLKRTLETVPCDLVLCATPIDLAKILKLTRPTLRVTYEYREMGGTPLGEVVDAFLNRLESTP